MNAAQLPNLIPLLPEFFLCIGAMALLLVGVYRPADTSRFIDGAAIVLLALAGVILAMLPPGKLVTFGGSFIVDEFARFLKILALLGSAAAIVMSIDYAKREGQERFEYSVLILLSTLGMLMLISAADLIALYLGLELMSLPLYVVAASYRSSLRATEAGLKYFVLGALSSGMLLYGASLIYGFTGTVSFAGIAHAAGQGGIGLIFGIVFLFAGFCFKVSAVPFHMWTPDVYEGAPTPVTAFFSAAPKVAGMAMFVRTAVMAYPSIGHMGFALIGLAAGTSEGVQGVLVYIAIYVTMTLGVFAVILSMRRATGMVESIDQLAGLARTQPTMAFFLAMLLFSMAGVPPLAGFFAKYYVFLAAIKAGLYVLAVIGVVTSVIGAYYYLSIVKIMYFDEPVGKFEQMPYELRVVLAICGLFNIFFFVYPAPLVGIASAAAHSLF